MKIDDLINQIENILDEGKSAFGGNKVKVDADAIRSILVDLRVALPDEVVKARQIASERKQILSQANDAADVKIRQAEAQARKLVEEHEITKAAQSNASDIITEAKQQAADIITAAKASSNEIVDNAQKWASDLRSSASAFVDSIMNETDDILAESIDNFTKSLNRVRVASKQLKSVTEKKIGQ